MCATSPSDTIHINVALHKLDLNGEFPIFSMDTRKIQRIESFKFNKCTDILKQCFKIFAFDGVVGVGQQKLPFCVEMIFSAIVPR